MDVLIHVGVFYLVATLLHMEKKWFGMVCAALPDIILILFFWVLPSLGVFADSKLIVDLHYFSHSLFALILFLPLLMYSMKYFKIAVLGYSSHLLLDYMTHASVRVALYPVSEWKVPIFVMSYFDTDLTLALNCLLLMGLLLVKRKNVTSLKRWVRGVLSETSTIIKSMVVLIAAIIFSWWNTTVFLHCTMPLAMLIVPIMVLNVLFVILLFFLEMGSEPDMGRIVGKYFPNISKMQNRPDHKRG